MVKSEQNVLVTGASGFLGNYVVKALIDHGDTVWAISRQSLPSHPAVQLINADLSVAAPQLPDVDFRLVIHLAGKAHIVPRTAAEERHFFVVNEQGTANLLASLQRLTNKPPRFILASTVAVYGADAGELITEETPLQPHTPYAKSKRQAEQLVSDWCQQNKVNGLIFRLPLIAGVNPPGNLGALIQALRTGRYLSIAGNQARKSIVLAKELAAFFATNTTATSGVFNLTDGVDPTFVEIETAIQMLYGFKKPHAMSRSILNVLAKFGDVASCLHLPSPLTSDKLTKMTSTLTFSDRKARIALGWSSSPVVAAIRENRW